MTLAPNNVAHNSTVDVAPTIGWELFSHDADVGIRGFGSTVAEAFEGAALAVTAAITDTAGGAETSLGGSAPVPECARVPNLSPGDNRVGMGLPALASATLG